MHFAGQTNSSISVWAESDTGNITDGMFVWKILGCSTWAQYGFRVDAIEANSVPPNKLNFYYRITNSLSSEQAGYHMVEHQISMMLYARLIVSFV